MAFSHANSGEGMRTRGPYRAFLLRCWLERVDGDSAWRFTVVQLSGNQARKGFARLEDVIAYMEDELDMSRVD